VEEDEKEKIQSLAWNGQASSHENDTSFSMHQRTVKIEINSFFV
jgi:hypothetical protein